MAGSRARRNRSAGKDWELKVIKLLKDRNLYPHAVSTRSESRNLDAMGIDIVNKNEIQVGMMQDSIQCKSMTKPVSYPKLLATIRDAGRPGPVVFHKQTGLSEGPKSTGKVFRSRDDFAITYLGDYINLMACRAVLQKLSDRIGTDETAMKVFKELCEHHGVNL